MKKLLVLSLLVVLTLTVAVVASASTFDPYVGGRITWAYQTGDAADENNPVSLGGSGLKMLLQGKISDKETGTWATIGAHVNNWNNWAAVGKDAANEDVDGSKAGLASGICDFGINLDNGLSIWYSNWENQNMKRGQDRIRGLGVDQYHRDPMFDHALAQVIGVDYKTDTMVLNFGYVPNLGLGAANADNSKEMAVAGTFKFDGGDVHVGYYSSKTEDTENLIGAAYKLGFGTIKVDMVSATPKDGDSVSQIQINASIDSIKLDVTVLSDAKYSFATDGGIGYQFKYSINDKMSVGYAALSASDEADEAGNMTDMWFGYKYGIFETRVGMGTQGTADENGMTYVSCYASLW